MKDPAFLFYSKDFYEGTRTMLPEERACYVDLMIYQHQNGSIPDDKKRILMYCSGISEATLIATLEAKFKLTNKGWINGKLETVILERQEFSDKQSINGKIGQFWKKSKQHLSNKEYKDLRKYFENKSINETFDLIKDLNLIEGDVKATLKGLLEHLAIANENDSSFNKITTEEFYKNQFELSGKDQNYSLYINALYGKNESGLKLTGILSMEEQLTFDQFKKLLEKCKVKNESLIKLSLSFENGKYYKDKKSLYLSLNDWLNKRP